MLYFPNVFLLKLDASYTVIVYTAHKVVYLIKLKQFADKTLKRYIWCPKATHIDYIA